MGIIYGKSGASPTYIKWRAGGFTVGWGLFPMALPTMFNRFGISAGIFLLAARDRGEEQCGNGQNGRKDFHGIKNKDNRTIHPKILMDQNTPLS